MNTRTMKLKPTKQHLLILTSILTVNLMGCSSSDYLNHEEYNQINSAAVVIYSVPSEIVSDTRDAVDISSSKGTEFNSMDMLSLAGSALGGAAKKVTHFIDPNSSVQKTIPGNEAANVALPQFISEMRKQKGWSIMSPQQVAANLDYQAYSTELMKNEDLASEKSASTRKAIGPNNYLEIGLPYNHTSTIDYYENSEFQTWVKKTAKTLNVDALIVMSDTGFATDGQSLFSGANCFTKSAFHFAIFNSQGVKIADTRASFEESTIIPQQGCVDGAFHKVDYINALKQHGRDQATAILDKLDSIK